MRNQIRGVAAATTVLTLTLLFGVPGSPAVVAATGKDTPVSGGQAAACTNATASGTYGYRMSGVIVGVGPFLVNGIFTHYPNGTMDADVHLVVGDQSFPLASGLGTFHTNSDCTGRGRFPAAPLGEVTYNFIATDGGTQIELLNTNPGVVLHGVGRRISRPGVDPRCRNEMIAGAYGYRLDGSLPEVPNVAVAGLVTHLVPRPTDPVGLLQGKDTLSLMGQFVARHYKGTFSVGSNCRGAGFYRDTLGQQVNIVFTVIDGGDTIFVQSADPGAALSGVAQRMRERP